MADNGRGPVDPGAHFYRSYQLDGEANPINKRNAWQTRSVLYVRLIPPGAADTVHFRLAIPKDAAGPVTLEAKLNYRKFAYDYTRFAYAGVAKPGSAGLDYDSREYTYDAGPVPDLPIVTLAHATATVALGEPHWQPVVRKQDRERWNDWGIGLLLQGDLKGAEYAFHRVTEAEPGYADGWVNIARALIQEGETDAARPYIEKALAVSPGLARGYFFLAMTQKAAGDYDGAIRSLRETERQYPRDRVTHQPVGPHPVPSAALCRGGRGAPKDARRRSRRCAGALQPDALLPRPGPERQSRPRGKTVSAIQGGRGVAGDHGQGATIEPRGQQ